MRQLLIIFLILFFYSCKIDNSVSINTEPQNIPELEIFMNNEDFQDFKNYKAISSEFPCKIKFKGQVFPATIESSGAGSRYYPKWSYKVKLNQGNIEGLSEFNLSAQVNDPSLLHNSIVSEIYRKAGFPVFKSFYAFVSINNKPEGLYPVIQRIEEEFFIENKFPVYSLFKIGFDTRFSFKTDYYPEFTIEKKIPENYNYREIYDLLNYLDTVDVKNLENPNAYIDIDNYLKYHSITSIINNPDAFSNNFFLYRASVEKPFQIIPWDFDRAFSLDMIIDGIAGDNEIINVLLSDKKLNERYYQLSLFFLESIFNDKLNQQIDSTANAIRYYYNNDPFLGKYQRFNLDNEVKKLKEFIINRKKFYTEYIDTERKNLK